MKNIEMNKNYVALTDKELVNINGGADATEAGEAVGELVGKVVKGVVLLAGIVLLRRKLF